MLSIVWPGATTKHAKLNKDHTGMLGTLWFRITVALPKWAILSVHVNGLHFHFTPDCGMMVTQVSGENIPLK